MATDLDDRSWLDGAKRVSKLVVDGHLRIAPSFYFGPVNGYTKAQWAQLREPIGVPLPSDDGWLPVELALTQLDAVIEHHRSLFEIARRHERPITLGSPDIWLRPRLVGDGSIAIGFGWTDTYNATDAALAALCVDRQGDLLSDLDQGWEILAVRRGADVVIGERDWEDDEDAGQVFAIDRDRFVAAASAARARIDDLLARITEALGEDPWGFRARTGGARSNSR